MSRSFQKRSTSTSISTKPARVDTSWNMDANSNRGSRSAEELAGHVEDRDRDHRREIHAQSGGDQAPQRPEDGLGDVHQESHEQPVVIADEPGGRRPHEDGKDAEINEDLGKGVQEIDGVLHCGIQRGPKSARPNRSMVAPSSTAIA